MSDLMNAIIAAKLVGGGGGGGGSGLPPITTEPTTILAEQSVAFSPMGGGVYFGNVSGQYPLEAGSQISTTWDGVPYDCIIQDFGGGALAWGNLAIVGEGADTGEPFLMMYDSGNGIDIGCQASGSHTVGLTTSATNYPDGSILIAIGGEWQKAEGYGYEVEEGGVPTVHKIDNKYLPFLMINVDTNNQTIDCDYLTYKAAVEAGVPIWLCDTEHDEYYALEGGELKVTNPTLTGSKWSYDSTQSAGHRLSASVLSVFMQVGSSGWSVTKVDYSTIEIPNV